MMFLFHGVTLFDFQFSWSTHRIHDIHGTYIYNLSIRFWMVKVDVGKYTIHHGYHVWSSQRNCVFCETNINQMGGFKHVSFSTFLKR